MLSEAQRKEIEERCNKATEGPWSVDAWINNLRAMIQADVSEHGFNIAAARILADFPTPGVKADASFIAHARTDIPTLLSDHRALTERVRELEGALRQAKSMAKEMRNSQKLVGPTEYHGRPHLMKVWVQTRYHAGKELYELIRATLKETQHG